MTVHAYIHACTRALADGMSIDAVIESLDATLKRRGHLKLWPRIFRMLRKVLEAELVKKEPSISVARAEDAERYQKDVRELLTASQATSSPRVTVRPELVGGFVITHGHTRIDKSYKRALYSLYKNITKST